MQEHFTAECETANTILKEWPRVMTFLQETEGPSGERLNQESNIPGLEFDLAWFDRRIISVGNLIVSLKNSKEKNNSPIPIKYINRLRDSVTDLYSNINPLIEQCQKIDEGKIIELNPGNWIITIARGPTHINIASLLQNLVNPLEEALASFYAVGSIVRSSRYSAFSAAIAEFSQKATEVRKSTASIRKLNNDAQKIHNKLKELKIIATSEGDAISEILKKSQNTGGDISSMHSDATGTLTAIDDISQAATTLEASVEAYEKTFLDFQNQLSDRNQSFQDWTEKVDELVSKLEYHESQIDNNIKNADKMLIGATNAALASTFYDTMVEFETKVKKARSAFHWSIIFLSISAIPLGLYLALSTLNFDTSKEAVKWFDFRPGELNPMTTFALALFMVPTTWLARFAAARHHQLFQLKEHYQYKYTLAMAVEGFKKQSPSHADEIAAQ
ncbi:MAG: hypothetical protein AAF441_11675, partial [Pseudomonadota bacterium]